MSFSYPERECNNLLEYSAAQNWCLKGRGCYDPGQSSSSQFCLINSSAPFLTCSVDMQPMHPFLPILLRMPLLFFNGLFQKKLSDSNLKHTHCIQRRWQLHFLPHTGTYRNWSIKKWYCETTVKASLPLKQGEICYSVKKKKRHWNVMSGFR